MKLLIALAFIAIIGALFAAGIFMLRGGKDSQHKSKKMAQSLALRVGLSVALFLGILVAYKLGWIHPTGLPTN